MLELGRQLIMQRLNGGGLAMFHLVVGYSSKSFIQLAGWKAPDRRRQPLQLLD
jgi:hypothetical protein